MAQKSQPSQKAKPDRKGPAKRPAEAGHSSLSTLLPWIGLGVLCIFILFVRIRLLNTPLERDEGEYALMGELTLKGYPPYELAYNMKLPGTSFMYALAIALFGKTAAGVHMGLLIVNLISILLLYLIGRQVRNEQLGLIAAASYGVLSVLPNFFGFASHATHFNVVYALLGLWALLAYDRKPGWGMLALSSLGFGASFIMKQQAIFLVMFSFFAFAFIAWRASTHLMNRLLRIGLYGVGLLIPYGLIVLIAYISGTLEKFLFWTVDYAREYAGGNDLSRGMLSLKDYFPQLTKGVLGFWILGFLGSIALAAPAWRSKRIFLLFFFLASMACTTPGLVFRPHYFVLFLPAVSLLGAITMMTAGDLLGKLKIPGGAWLSGGILLVLATMAVEKHADYLFKQDPRTIIRQQYGHWNPFVESEEIGRYLAENSTPDDRIAILGSEPQIYFYANRLPATGYIYSYPLMEDQPYNLDMQKNMIAEIEANAPKHIIFVSSPVSWLRRETSPAFLFDWFNPYVNDHYTRIGVVDLNPVGPSEFKWREAAATYNPQNEFWLTVFERKPEDQTPTPPEAPGNPAP